MSRSRTSLMTSALTPSVCAIVAVLVASLLVLASPSAQASAVPTQVAEARQGSTHSTRHGSQRHGSQRHGSQRHGARRHGARHRSRRVGLPPRDYVAPASSYFSYPNRGGADQVAIRNRVLYTIQSVWGGPRSSLGTPMPGNGSIRIATWSFDDMGVARALVAARNRGVSVQLVAAESANLNTRAWKWIRRRLGANLYRPGYPITRESYSFARECRGACRGPSGTPHAKYFLFDNVGHHHTHSVVVQTSMNLTSFAVTNQWNQAQVLHSASMWGDFMRVFREARLGRPAARPYHVATYGNVVNFFFPRPGVGATTDPVMQILRHVNCRSAASGRTRIRVVQYAIYGNRGSWIAKKLRFLWNHGCDVGIIYSVSSRPVLSILRNGSGRGAVPMRQSVTKDSAGTIVDYNHSKWMTITGGWGSSRAAWLTFSGSANWGDLAFASDEQMQRISSRGNTLRYLATYSKIWRQRSSTPPPFGRVLSAYGRMLPGTGEVFDAPDVPEGSPEFGHGVFRYMTQD